MSLNDPPDALDDRPSDDAPPPRGIVQTENLYLRNYDPYRAYDLDVAVTDTDGRTVFESSYYFQPGQTESDRGVLTSGEYTVTVTLDNRQQKTDTCRVGPSLEETIHVELGNGIVSIGNGLYR